MFCQFGSLLDENAGSKFDNIGLNAMANADKAGRECGVSAKGSTRETTRCSCSVWVRQHETETKPEINRK